MPRSVKQPTPKQFKANLPPDILTFLTEEAGRFGSSVNSEITRAIRERMDRVRAATEGRFGDTTSAAAFNRSGLAPAGNVHHG